MSETRTIKTDLLARVEGEGAMFLRIRNGRVDDVRLHRTFYAGAPAFRAESEARDG